MKRNGIDVLGVLFGLIAICIVLFSAVMLFTGTNRSASWSPFTGDFRPVSEGGRGEESGEETVEGDFRSLDLQNVAGAVGVHGWENDYIQINYVKRAPSRKQLDLLYVDIVRDGSRLSISRESQRTGGLSMGTVSFDIFVPKTLEELKIRSVSGAIELDGMTETVNQELYTTSGRIRTDNSGSLEAKSVSGSVEFTFAGKTLDIRTTSGRIEGSVQSLPPGGSIDINSISGSVRIAVPSDFSARVDLRSVSGSVDTDLPIEVYSSRRSRLEGIIGGGDAEAAVSTVSGSIKIREL